MLDHLRNAWHLWWPVLAVAAVAVVGCLLDPGKGLP